MSSEKSLNEMSMSCWQYLEEKKKVERFSAIAEYVRKELEKQKQEEEKAQKAREKLDEKITALEHIQKLVENGSKEVAKDLFTLDPQAILEKYRNKA